MPEDKATAESKEQKPTVDEDKKLEAKPEKPPAGEMYIKVYSPFKVYFDALGVSISAENDTGPFDILVGHHRFLTLLSACEIEIRTKSDDGEKIKIDRGIMYVKEDRVTVFLDV
jgi:F0F1-type ATP synthase epsilon subunit